MSPLRTLALSTLFCGILCTPLFVFAQVPQMTPEQIAANQTATNSAEAQEAETKKLQQQITKYESDLQKLIEEKTKQILTPAEIEKKAIGDYLDIKVNPKSPGPNEPVRITIESYLSDLQKATMEWSLNGKVVSRGIARTVFNFQNGPSGKPTVVSVTITTNMGKVITKEFSFSPVGVTILWEADTYTPPFYKGKALMVPQARVRVAAVPDTASTGTLGAGNLVYTWEKDGTVYTSASGYGKNVFSFVGPIPLTQTNVRVTVSSMDDTMNSEMRVYVPLSRPLILFYEKHPLLGILYNKPLSTEFSLDKKEFSISAEPYFFSNEDSETPTIKYGWAVNGSSVQNYGREITLRNDAGIKGDSAVSLAMRGINRTFQNASRDLKVHFADEGGSEGSTF